MFHDVYQDFVLECRQVAEIGECPTGEDTSDTWGEKETTQPAGNLDEKGDLKI